ncbi:hypothetical protein DFH08DRAFT_900772 [Mycena albidolilacea]|uniref:Uncharacterized protein n=1 Tax=Mycena albidolilacea TaxID=1033008 RepID=A0AAD7EAI3_9AGAR|nr:hypothetical protein DFH08DRAFT_900772 [Mycena albidolilacea]
MPQAFSWRCRVIILAMWAATAVGISLNMTSPDPLPAGGTVIVAWARDNGTITPNPSQFGLYIYPDAGDNLVVSQIVNAGSQPSGTVTMVIPPETSPDSYDIYAFQGPDTNIPPAMWGWGFNLAAAVQSASVTRPASTAVTASSSSPTPSDDPQTLSDLSHSSTTTSNRGSQTLSDNPQSLSGASQSSTAPTKSSASNSSPSNTNPATSAGATTGGPSSTAIVLTTKHAVPTGAIAGIVVGLFLVLVGVALLLLFLRRRRQQARRRFSAPETNHRISLSTPLPIITPFTSPPSTMTEVAAPIREKDAVIGAFSSKAAVSPTTTSSASGSSSQLSPAMISEREHRERVERLEREVQLLRQQQQQSTNFSDEPPPEYNTL